MPLFFNAIILNKLFFIPKFKKPFIYNDILLKIKYNKSIINVNVKATQKVAYVKLIVAGIIGYQSNNFYLSTHAKYLNESKTLGIYDLKDKEISVIFRIKEGSDIPNIDNSVLAISHPITLHRHFFLDKDNSPNTWLLLIDFSFTS